MVLVVVVVEVEVVPVVLRLWSESEDGRWVGVRELEEIVGRGWGQ